MPLRVVRYRNDLARVADVKMNWAAIFAGTSLTLGFMVFFLLIGNAVGLNGANTIRAGISGALKFWSWIYVAATFVFSYFLGAFLSTRSTMIDSPSSGMVHGLTAWGLATFVFMAVGSLSAIGVRILLAGLAVDSANWLAACIVGLGLFAAAVGGLAGKYSEHETTTRSEGETITRAA